MMKQVIVLLLSGATVPLAFFPETFRNAIDNIVVPVLVWISTVLTVISGAVYLKGYWHLIDSDK
jgi:ABC-type uncharacterized transport system permease subunit